MKVTIHTGENAAKVVKITEQQLIDIGAGRIQLNESSDHPLYKELMQAEVLDCSNLVDDDSDPEPILACKKHGLVLLAQLAGKLSNLEKVNYQGNELPQMSYFSEFDKMLSSSRLSTLEKIANGLSKSISLKEIDLSNCTSEDSEPDLFVKISDIPSLTTLKYSNEGLAKVTLDKIKKYNEDLHILVKEDMTLKAIMPNVIVEILNEYLFAPEEAAVTLAGIEEVTVGAIDS